MFSAFGPIFGPLTNVNIFGGPSRLCDRTALAESPGNYSRKRRMIRRSKTIEVSAFPTYSMVNASANECVESPLEIKHPITIPIFLSNFIVLPTALQVASVVKKITLKWLIILVMSIYASGLCNEANALSYFSTLKGIPTLFFFFPNKIHYEDEKHSLTFQKGKEATGAMYAR